MSLQNWIQEEYCSPSYIGQFDSLLETSPTGILVLDNFLNPEVLHSIQSFLQNEATYFKRYKLKGSNYDCDYQEFQEASIEDRLLSLEQVLGADEKFKTSRNSFTYQAFKLALKSKSFFDYFGVPNVGSISSITVKRLKDQDFFAPHNDSSPGRRLCCVLYVSPDWKKEYGNALAFDSAQGPINIDALCNRLVVFKPHASVKHWLTPKNPTFKQVPRYNFSWWYFDS